MIIKLSQEEVRVCTLLAVERWFAKYGSIDKPNYAKGKKEGRLTHELLANIQANVCEWAVAKVYNISWTVPFYPNELHPRRKDIPDVGVNGEVRSVRTYDSIPFWNKDKGKLIYGCKVLDDDYYSEIEIYGCFYPDEYFTDEYHDKENDTYRFPICKLQELNHGI